MVKLGALVVLGIVLVCFLLLQFYVYVGLRDVSDNRTFVKELVVEFAEEATMAPVVNVNLTEEVVEEERTPLPEQKVKNGSIVIPFHKKSWYKLFRHYQLKNRVFAENSSVSFFSPPFSVHRGPSFSLLYAHQGCIDIFKHSVYLLDSSRKPPYSSFHLRLSSSSHPIHIDGFEDVSLFIVSASLPSDVSSNLTWVLLTPPVRSDECGEAFLQYFPPFYHSIHPLFSRSVVLSVLVHRRSSALCSPSSPCHGGIRAPSCSSRLRVFLFWTTRSCCLERQCEGNSTASDCSATPTWLRIAIVFTISC